MTKPNKATIVLRRVVMFASVYDHHAVQIRQYH